ncbi:hypothetical protein L7F22_059877 [Adiantum nelumboides]|nr:hypothetical protein [Adiantum nelumboides]
MRGREAGVLTRLCVPAAAGKAKAKPAAIKAAAAKKAALKGTSGQKIRKVRTSVSFRRPKTLQLARSPDTLANRFLTPLAWTPTRRSSFPSTPSRP